MKKVVFLFFLMCISYQFQAQENQAFQEKAVRLIKMTSGQQFDIMLNPVVQMVPEANRQAFKKEMMTSLESIYSRMAELYMNNFTEAEIDQILAFYNTPVGKKMVQITPELTKKRMEIGQQWGQELQPMMMKYMQN